MPTVKNISIKDNTSSTGYDTREIGADALNVDVQYDASGKIITDLSTQTVDTSKTKSLPEVLDSAAPTDHSDSSTKYGVATTSKYGHVKVGTGLNVNNGEVSVKYGSAQGTAVEGNDSRLSDARKNPNALTFADGTSYDGSIAKTINAASVSAAPTDHASTARTYGVGTSANFGHLKITDTYKTNVGAAADGITASQKALYEVYQEAIKSSGSAGRELTQAQYDALTETEKTDGTIYFITDAEGGGGASTADNVSYDNSISKIVANNVQEALDLINGKTNSNTNVLGEKADNLFYDETNSLLYLRVGNTILSSIHIESEGIATIIHVDTHEEDWFNNPNVTIEVKNSVEDIDNGHFDENGDYYCKIHYLDTYIITVTDEDGNIWEKTFEDTELGKVYYIFIDKFTTYAFHIDGNNSDPNTSVTYPIGSENENFIPSKMNYTSGQFEYGSWENAFFIPKPCLLDAQGNVFKYLNPNDYTKDVDGNDVTTYLNGTTGTYNAMMEWGKDGRKIYYKIVPDSGASSTSATVYISNGKIDEDFVCYSFYNEAGVETDHFYTPIYNGSVKSNVLRSISGQTPINTQTATTEMNYAKANGAGWCTETLADRVLINFLLVLMGKSLDTQTTFGMGYYEGGSSTSNPRINTGTMNTKGLFWGSTSKAQIGVKVFGMENYWGNQWRRIAGWINDKGTQKIKLTYGTNDGSSVTGYNETGAGYINVGSTPGGTSGGYTSVMTFNKYGMFNTTASGSSSTYYCDGLWFNNSQVDYASVGGNCDTGLLVGAFYSRLNNPASATGWDIGAAVSFRK